MKKNHVAFLFLVMIFLLPALSFSCPMCQGEPSKDTIQAYKGITLFLALLPILGSGGIFYWIYIRSKSIEENRNQGI